MVVDELHNMEFKMHQFVELMKKIENSGTFSVSGKLDPLFPGLVIKDVGEISLPLSAYQAEEIIKQCEQAPFGFREETIVDTNVRNVWQISPTAVELTNPQWDLVIANACKEVAKQLGLSDCKINFELYKVLVYAKGSFFQEHRDTEKIQNMFATMVVNLPSTHEGGELIVKHGGESKLYSFAGKSKFYPEFAAFYADCYHEVKPLRSGYRLALIYNLAIADREQQPLLSQQEEIIDQVDACIQKWSQSKGDRPIFAYLLDHSYSEQHLSISTLKNNDFPKVCLLLKSAEKNHCKAFLCLVSYIEESYGDYWEGKGYRRHEEVSESNFEEYEITHQEIYAHHFISSQGEKIDVESLTLDENEIFAEIPLREGPGREVSISEATGNAGATKELWYHRGAIIMWPEHSDLDIVLKIDIAYGIYYFKKMIQEQDISGGENRKKAITLANHIVDNQKFLHPNQIIDSLIALGDIEVLRKEIRSQLKYGLSRINSKTIVRILDQFFCQAFEEDLHEVLNRHKDRQRVVEALSWLYALLLEKPSFEASYPLITRWFQEIWKSSLTISDVNEAEKGLGYIFQILSLLGNQRLTDEVLLSIQKYQEPLSMPFIYAPSILAAVKSYKRETHSLDILKKIAKNFLEHAQFSYAAPPKPPENWKRAGQLKCTCNFCREVKAFLSDPYRENMVFEKALQRDLIHIKTTIAEHSLDLDIHIDRQPSKFKGTLTKNQNSYKEALKRFTIVEKTKKSVELELSCFS